jgi:cytochrome c oxidase assembly protein subunit 11
MLACSDRAFLECAAALGGIGQKGTGATMGGDRSNRRRATAVVLVAVVGGMIGLSFASVPLYRLFCQVTGYGGTPRTENVASAPGGDAGTVTVRFDANVSSDLPWRFEPSQRQVTVRLGEETLVHYTAVNLADRQATGTATFSVTPYKAAPYFSKVECFCFTEQRLLPGQVVSMPVVFFVDPAIASDRGTRDVTKITLSYTFFPAEDRGRSGQKTPAVAKATAKLPADG